MASPSRALYTRNYFDGDGTTVLWDLNFMGGYISRDHVKAYYFDNTTGAVTTLALTSGNWTGDFQLTITPAVPAGNTLVIYRSTPRAEPLVSFVQGARMDKANFDLVSKQAVFCAAEAIDLVSEAESDDLLAYVQTAITAAQDATTAAAAASSAAAAANTNANSRVLKAGDAMTGQLSINAPGAFPLDVLGTTGNTARLATTGAVDVGQVFRRNGVDVATLWGTSYGALLNGTTGVAVGVAGSEIGRFHAGGLAIGATSSAYELYVYKAAANVSAMIASGTAGDSILYLNANGVSQNWIRTQRTTGDLVFGTADTDRGRLSYTGNLLIGTPDNTLGKLAVRVNTNQNFYARNMSGVTDIGSRVSDTVFNDLSITGYTIRFNYGNSNAEAMRIGADGNVGLGTAPVMPVTTRGLHIHNAVSTQRAGIRLTNADVGSTASDGAAMIADPAGVFYLWNYENASVILGTNNTDRVTITGAGTVLVGRSSQQSGGLMEVNGRFVQQAPAAAPTLTTNRDMTFQLVSDTQLRVHVRGSDGVTRVANLTLA